MISMEGQDRRAKKSSLVEHLHNPTELRGILLAVILGIGYATVYLPLDTAVATTTRKLEDAKKRLKLAEDVENLQKQFRQVQSRIPSTPDASEWMQYVLNGLRQSPLRLETFSPDQPKALGSYQILTMKIKVSGAYEDLDKMLYWFESNPRLFRVDSVKLAPGGGKGGDPDDISMELTVVGVMG
jgi:Tfp pilus assembly protein PilO